MTAQLALLDEPATDEAANLRAHGLRFTPPECIDLLCSLPEWRARSGDALDLGVGDGALCRGIHERIPSGPGSVRSWLLFDVRPEALESMADWQPRGVHVERHVHDATAPGWPAEHALPYIERVVSNPPWALLQCVSCRRTWPARDRGTACSGCRAGARDVAIEMVRGVMAACPRADVWVLHNSDWPFHAERSRFWGPDAPKSHVFAGRDELSGIRVAYADPIGAPVQPHNRPSVWYHWVPRRRYRGQHVRFHSWPLETI